MIIYSAEHGNFAIAEQFHASGLNIVPLRLDGSKRPSICWQRWTQERYPWFQCQHHFRSRGCPSGIGILCGLPSGNLEVIDFDCECSTVFPCWSRLVEAKFPGLATLPIVETPRGGRHVYYRCETIDRSRKLAETEPDANGRTKVIIETRGQGALVVAPGSPPATHPLGKPYLLIEGDLFNVPTISAQERSLMFAAARTFNCNSKQPTERPNRRATPIRPNVSDGKRPGDVFNRSATWEQILEPHGWTIASYRGETTYWRKPENYGPEHHATTAYGGRDTLHVFSSAAPPFEQHHEYKKFAAFTLLNHGGDFRKAAKALIAGGQASFDRGIYGK
jgi:putative DNA primase/helicase